ncbi:MAG TPA: ABC transporter ATP-binding protein [Abditibacteriaceae bacterium]|jgi:ABC-2 type transport system ATP-binding protein
MPLAEATQDVTQAETAFVDNKDKKTNESGTSQAAPAATSLNGQPGEVIIQTNNLKKVYRAPFSREGKTALHSLTIDVKRGEIFGLVGPNGSGKTTTLKLLLGLIKPTEGDISVFGRGPNDVAVKKRIGFLPDGPYFYDYLNSYEVLDFYGRLFGFSAEDRARRAEKMLDQVNLNPADRKRPIRTYSKGMMQRVGLAQALLNDPELLFLDEPTTGLDPIGARQMKDAILAVRDSGKTVLLCSHLLADVQAICDRVAIISEGQLVKFGTVPELVGPSQRFEVYAGNVSKEAKEQARAKNYQFDAQDDGIVVFHTTSSDQLDEVLSFVRDANARTIDVKGYSETLEDVFVRSVKSDGR